MIPNSIPKDALLRNRIDIYSKEITPFSDDEIKNTSEKSIYINENGTIIKKDKAVIYKGFRSKR